MKNVLTIDSSKIRTTHNSHSRGVPNLPYGKVYLRLARKTTACQLFSGLTDVQSTKISNYYRDDFEQELRRDGIREGWLLNLRDKTKNPVTKAVRLDLESLLLEVENMTLPNGPTSRIAALHKKGEILSFGDLIDIIAQVKTNGDETLQRAKTEQAHSIINDLVEKGMLEKLDSKNGKCYYKLTGTVIIVAPGADFIDDELRRAARIIRYRASDNDQQFGVSLRLCSQGLEEMTDYLHSAQIEHDLGLSEINQGGEPSFGAVLTFAPITKDSSISMTDWELAADRAINDTVSRMAERSRLIVGLAALGEEHRDYYLGGGVSNAWDALKDTAKQFAAKNPKAEVMRQSYGFGLFYSEVDWD